MKKVMSLCVALVALTMAATAATENWNVGGNWVSYSANGIVDGNMGALGGTITALDTFNEATALVNEGVACTLTRVVISINGQLAYSIKVDSENGTPAAWDVGIFGTGATISHAVYSATEVYSGATTLELGADDEVGAADFAGVDYGEWGGTNLGHDNGSSEYNSGLAYFTTAVSGPSLNWDVNYQLTLGVSGPNAGIETSGVGTAGVSITYYYEPVPEPTSLALVGLGGLVVALRRRFAKKA